MAGTEIVQPRGSEEVTPFRSLRSGHFVQGVVNFPEVSPGLWKLGAAGSTPAFQTINLIGSLMAHMEFLAQFCETPYRNYRARISPDAVRSLQWALSRL